MILNRPARATDPATSHIAAEHMVTSGGADSDRRMILASIKAVPGMTAGEIAQCLGWGNANVRVTRRTIELRRDGLIDYAAARVCSVKGTRMTTFTAKGIT